MRFIRLQPNSRAFRLLALVSTSPWQRHAAGRGSPQQPPRSAARADRGSRRPLRRSGSRLHHGGGNPDQPVQPQTTEFGSAPEEGRSPHIRFHDLRHTSASLLFQQGVYRKFAQELLGHASVAIMLDTYSHMLPGMGDEVATAMEDVLSQGASTVMPTGLSSVRESASPMHRRLAAGPSFTPGS